MPGPSSPQRAPRLLRASLVLGALLAVYGAFGFLAAPRILRGVLVKQATAALHRDVSIADVRVNPLALSVTIRGLAVKDHDGAPFAGWDTLYVRLSPLRLLAREIALSEIRLVRPSIHVGLRPDGSLSFQDLLSPEPPAATSAVAAKPQQGLAVSIGKLAVEEARVAFHDASRRPTFDTTLGPLTIRLESFRTTGGGDSPYSFTGTTDAGETFRWTGTVSTMPFRSAGTLAFERIALRRYGTYVRDVAPVELHDGLVDLETRYDVEWGAGRRAARITGGKVSVDRLSLGPAGVASPPVKLPRIEVSGIEVDALARDARVREVAVRGGTLRVVRDASGALELARMAPPPSPPPASPWRWSIDALSISGVDVQAEDRAAPRPVALRLADVQLRVEQLRSDPAATWPIALSLLWEGRGRLAVKGPVQPLASKAKLELDAAELDLVPLAPYLEPVLAARLAGGRAGARLALELDGSGAAPRWAVAGDVRLDGLAVAEKGNDDLLRWSALELSGIDAASAQRRASVRLVRLVEPRVKAYVWEDGTTSVTRARRAPAASAAPAPTSAPWQTAIAAVQVVRGKATLVDRSVKPAAVVNVTRADGKVTSLSSEPKVRSTVDVGLQIEGASPLRVSGTLNPLQKEAYTDLVVASEGVDLSPLDPYSGKFLGYGIQKGKLDLDLRYRIVNRSIAATNVVKVNQFTLGAATESPDATKIPVRLALALLQDKDGVILLDVPIEGNLDDPEFHLGRVIWHTIQSLLVKVATSPFRALAALAGGGDADLSMIDFAPGAAELLPSSQERLSTLARSLAQRPAIGLELEGSADAEQDGRALRLAAVERALRRAKAAAMQPPPPSPDDVTVTPDERPRLVHALHQAAFPAGVAKADAAKGDPAAAALSTEQLLERLVAAQDVAPEALRSLAAERAQRAREALVAGGVEQARLFLATSGGPTAEKKGARVYFTAR